MYSAERERDRDRGLYSPPLFPLFSTDREREREREMGGYVCVFVVIIQD